MVFKIDWEKAYNRLSWNFIKDTVIEFNIDNVWIELIMSYVANGHSFVLWNGKALDGINNGRGLRQ